MFVEVAEGWIGLEKYGFLQSSVSNLEWLRDNYEEIKKKYDKQWIVIDNSQVVAHCATYVELVNLKLPENKGVLIEFIDSKQIEKMF